MNPILWALAAAAGVLAAAYGLVAGGVVWVLCLVARGALGDPVDLTDD